jgi:hypothetical protein
MRGRGRGFRSLHSSAAQAEGGDLLLQLLPEVPPEGLSGMAAAVAHVAAKLGGRVGAAQADAVQQVFRLAAGGDAAVTAEPEGTREELPLPAAAAAAAAGDAAAAAAAGDMIAAAAAAGSQAGREETQQQKQQQQSRSADRGSAAAGAAAVTSIQLQMLYGWLRLWCKRGNQEQMAAVVKTMASLVQQPAAAAAPATQQ